MNTPKKRKLVYLLVVIVILGLGLLGWYLLRSSKKQLVKHRAETAAPLVKTVNAKVGNHHVIITGEGTVRPVNEISLVPQVEGKIQYTSSSMVNCGEFKKGDTLLRIEPLDYELAVTLT
ncbi:MAG: hypothetical protein JRF34_05895, partial [Deltaproteobacteria bacterium]|nr:hypothetical protein [Deltaproteobacteria bacterium]